MATRLYLIIIALLLVTGCAGRGLLYTNNVRTYALDLKDTPVGSKVIMIPEHRVTEPITGWGMSTILGSKTVAAAAREAGMTKIYYADRRTISVFLGLYRKRTLIIYGE